MMNPKIRFANFNVKWEIIPLGKCCSFFSGGTPRSSDKSLYNGSIPFIGSGNINDNEVFNFINKTALDNSSAKMVETGDILYALYGANSGDIAISKINGAINQAVLCIRTKQNKNFLVQLLIGKKNDIVNRFLQGGQGNLSAKIVKNLKFHFPSLPEQQKIASFLSTVDKKINLLESKIEHLEQYKKGVVQKIFNQEIRFKPVPHETSGNENGKSFPEWEKKKGNEVFKSVSNKDHNGELPILAITQEFGAIPRDQIEYNITVTTKSVESYKKVEKGDFIISLRSFQGGIEYSEYEGICSPAYIILKNIIPINDTFYKVFLKTPNYIKELNRTLEGIRDGKMISFKYFSDVSVPYPSIKEQTKIANFLSSLDKKIDLHKTQLEKMKTWKKGLLQKMFV